MTARILVKSAVQIIADAKGLMKGRKDDGPEFKSAFSIELILTGRWGAGCYGRSHIDLVKVKWKVLKSFTWANEQNSYGQLESWSLVKRTLSNHDTFSRVVSCSFASVAFLVFQM